MSHLCTAFSTSDNEILMAMDNSYISSILLQ